MYLKSDTLLLADIFENFRKMYLELYQLDPAKFLAAAGLAWQAALKNTKVELGPLTDIDILLIVGKGIRGGICHSINRYTKVNKKYMKNYDENEESSYLKYWDVNNLYGWTMSQKLPVNGFRLVEDLSEFDEGFIKTYNEKRRLKFCSFFVACYFLLFTFCSLLVTFCLLLVTFRLLLVNFCSLLVTFFSLLVTEAKFFACCSLLVTFCSLFVTFLSIVCYGNII